MTSARRIEANRRNAQRSTGPRTREGKARAAQNARRHGLNLPLGDRAWAEEIAVLARMVAGPGADPQRRELACRVAAAQIDIVRVRRARRDLLPAAKNDPNGMQRLAAIDDYERRALTRRERAIVDFDAAADSQSWENEPNGPKRTLCCTKCG